MLIKPNEVQYLPLGICPYELLSHRGSVGSIHFLYKDLTLISSELIKPNEVQYLPLGMASKLKEIQYLPLGICSSSIPSMRNLSLRVMEPPRQCWLHTFFAQGFDSSVVNGQEIPYPYWSTIKRNEQLKSSVQSVNQT